MSPEQARGEEIDARTDLWSLGVLLYELATGVRPFDGSASPVIFTQILSQQPVPVHQRNPKVPPELERVISRLLEKDRETRYQSAADVRADLRRIARDSSDPVAVAARPEVGSRPGRRGIVIVASLVAALALAFVGWKAFRGDDEPIASPAAWQQLTNFTDALVDPSLSPDGRMVTFIRASSPAQFPRVGHIFVKLLPAGESVQLTRSIGPRYAPGFTPDGSGVAYTEIAQAAGQSTWDTWTVPIGGGEPTRMLPNASGLVWIDAQHVLFSQIMGSGIHMGIVTSTTGRADERPIYFPEHERAMAHYSYLSPDRRSVLIVEMDRTAQFQRCRLMPFDGQGAGTQVGPPGACVAAAWSPDGQWMYFSVFANGASHLWRQRFPNGAPQQLTFGPTEENGVAVAPDGRSLITSVGQRRSAIWLKTPQGEREVSIEGLALAPTLSIDGRRLYYLLQQRSREDSFVEFRTMDLSTGRTDRPLPDRSVLQYDLSPDERDVAFTTRAPGGAPEIWLAPLDRSAPPRRVTENGDSVSFAGPELVFRELDGKANYLTRIGRDGSGRRRIIDTPIVEKGDSSPDGAWVIAAISSDYGRTGVGIGAVIQSLRGTAQIPLCPRGGYCPAIFSPDGRWLYVTLPSSGDQPRAAQKSLAIRMGDHGELPDALESLVAAAAQGTLPPQESGRVMLDGVFLSPGPDPSTYAYVKQEVQSNLYRIAIR
jgi:Tol biopolymer transport system component